MMRKLINFFKELFSSFGEDNPSRLAAALAYRGVFSLAPLLLIAVMVVGVFFGQQAAQNEIAGLLESTVGPDAAVFLEDALASASLNTSSERWFVSLISVGALLYAASGLFNELKGSINTLWHVPTPPSAGVMGFVKNKVVAVSMVLGVGVILLLLMAANTAVSIFIAYFSLSGIFNLLSLAVSFGALILLIAFIYKVAPDADMKWGDLWIGAGITALLLTLGIWLIGLYLTYSSVGSAYGAAGTLLVILIWIYYSALIFLFGAKFTQVYARKYGSKIVPTAEEEAESSEEGQLQTGSAS